MLEWITLCGLQLLIYTKMQKNLSNEGITHQIHIRFNKVSVREESYRHSITSFLTMACYI